MVNRSSTTKLKNDRGRASKQPTAGEDRFALASKYWDKGDVKRAFRLFSLLAREGDPGAQLNVGYFFDAGLGVRRNQSKALYWYRRSHAAGHASSANNIATIYRDRGDFRRAADWFSRALKNGDEGAALEIAKIYSHQRKSPTLVRRYLKRVANSARVTQSDSEQAKNLLNALASRKGGRTNLK